MGLAEENLANQTDGYESMKGGVAGEIRSHAKPRQPESHNVNTTKTKILTLVDNNPGISQSELIRKLGISGHGYFYRMIYALLHDGLLTSKAATNERGFLVKAYYLPERK